MKFDPHALLMSWSPAQNPLPVVIFGAGSIVRDAHLPAWRRSGIPVQGVYDPNQDKARQLGSEWDVPVFETVDEAVEQGNVVFDLATPPDVHSDVLRQLPDHSAVLLQKPMGRDLGQANDILSLCRQKRLTAAVNFQLRFAPMALALKDAIAAGWLGRIVDIDASFSLDTPWHLWKFLEDLPRVEIAVHSIHYFDLIRQLVGNPKGVHAKTISHPRSNMAQSRTAAILDYGDDIRCVVSVNHDQPFGRKFQRSEFRICGTDGAAYLKLGVNLDYPHGEPDELWIYPKAALQWTQIPLRGAWFPDAFVYRMANFQRSLSGEDNELVSSVEDAWHTMALVEAAYTSTATPATPVPALPG